MRPPPSFIWVVMSWMAFAAYFYGRNIMQPNLTDTHAAILVLLAIYFMANAIYAKIEARS